MRDLLRRMQPTGFDDIVAVLALYRPGPMGMNAHNDYADRKNGRQEVKPIHPELEEPLEEILADTYGLIVYQEQIMQIAQKVAGYSLGQADILRRAMGKKKLSVLEEAYAGFREGMLANDFSEPAIKALWDTILPFAGYAFNKSHAAGYGLVSFWTAYLKANYPAEYMAGLLTSVGDDKDKAAIYLADCRKMGITVLPPDVNESERQLRLRRRATSGSASARSATSAPTWSARSSRRARRSRSSPTSPTTSNKIDAIACSKKVTESLIKAGGFDSLGHPRKGLMLVHADAIDAVMGTKKAEAIGQFDLFGGSATATSRSPRCSTSRCPRKSGTPSTGSRSNARCSACTCPGTRSTASSTCWRPQSDTPIPAILEGDVKDGAQVTIGGILASVNRRINKNGLAWASAQLEDLTGGIEVLFFPQSYSVYGMDVVEDAVVLVKARVSIRDDRISLIANDLACPISRPVGVAKPVAVVMTTASCAPRTSSARSRQVLTRHPGTSDVYIRHVGASEKPPCSNSTTPAGLPVLGVDGRSESAARTGLPGLSEQRRNDPLPCESFCRRGSTEG